jgi:carboxyl-terminal processing protease
VPDIPLDDSAADKTAALRLREADLTKHLTDITREKEQAEEKAQAEAAAVKYNFTPAPRPKEADDKAARPEPGEIVSKSDYELNQAVAFLKSRTLARAN